MPGQAVIGMPRLSNPGPRNRIRTRVQRERGNAEELGDIYKFTRDPKLDDARAEARREARAETKHWRFVECWMRGCHEPVPSDTPVMIRVCFEHALEIWESVERNDRDPYFSEVLQQQVAKRDELRAALRKQDEIEAREFFSGPDAPGQIYYARVGGLIKVGWTSDLYSRIRSYGADVELLANYSATRQDETNLHRNLAPSRAKGREWYNDDAIIRAFIANAIREHGEPDFREVAWTKPKQIVAGKRVLRLA